MNIGVLALQGGVIEHLNAIKKCGHNGIKVKTIEDLDKIDGLILPGGESTTIGNILNITGLFTPLRNKIKAGFPVWGTCAGMILLAYEIENDTRHHLQVMNIKVRRNAYGSQIDSFRIKKLIPDVSQNEIELIFIRAPYIVDAGENVQVLSFLNGHIIAARQDNILATSFHPELTNDTTFLNYFLNMCNQYN